MRIFPLFLILAACTPEPPEKPAENLLYAGQGRDRLCMKGERIGFITFGEGDTNCSVRGRVERADGKPTAILPDGDDDCRIALSEEKEALRLGTAEATCGYYCGPGASFTGKAFTADASATPAIDFAGDPLC